MPIVKTSRRDKPCQSNPQELVLKQQLLAKIAVNSGGGNGSVLSKDGDSDSIISDGVVEVKDYEEMIAKTRDIPLQKIIYSSEGWDLFNELCLRIDINQRYAELLPQWTDVAHLLEVDSLKTKWVETCVRPREGLTRAMLEIYMNDGGTLGDVLGVLVELGCFDILEVVREKVERYTELHSMGSPFDPSGGNVVSDKHFSMLKTLIKVLGNADPCVHLQKFVNGLVKHAISNGTDVSNTDLVRRSEPPERPQDSGGSGFFDDVKEFKSDIHLDQFKRKDVGRILDAGKRRCKVLLLFSQDGVADAERAVELARTVSHRDVEADLFRLNEVSLWYEALANPEACCLKWSYEADYIMPVLTPMFLQEIHCNRLDSDEGLLPTSPVLNRYMYTLARTQYTQAGSKNLKVRPLIPQHALKQVRLSNALRIDPLLNSSWVPLNEERFATRIRGILDEFARKMPPAQDDG